MMGIIMIDSLKSGLSRRRFLYEDIRARLQLGRSPFEVSNAVAMKNATFWHINT
jgi:hypothetical protein